MSPIGGGLGLSSLGARLPVHGGGGGNGPLLPSDRATTWNPGLNSVGGIPNRTTIFRTLTPSGGDDSAAIQSACDACPNGQVVMLAAGTFIVNNLVVIDHAITLRGAGAGTTFVKKTNGATMLSYQATDYQPFVVMGPNRWPGPDSTSHNLTADAVKGGLSVVVANTSGFVAGQFVILDELSGASWQTDPLGRGKIWAAPDWRVTWQFHNPANGIDDPLVATTPTSGDAASWFCRQDRPTSEVKQIASISGNTITFTTPIHISYRISHTAQLTGYTNNPLVQNAGVENLTATGFSDGCIRFECAAFCWVKNVEITVWLNEGVAINNSFKCELRNSYIHDGAWPEPGGGGYAISSSEGSSEYLVENNISIRANKVMVARCSGAGSVVGYNYTDEGFILTNENWIEIGLNGSHMVGPHHMLFEGNYSFNWDSDKTHGSSIYHTIFRNWLRGVRSGPFTNPETGNAINDSIQTDNGPRRCAGSTAYSYWMSFIGNVLGAQGQMSGFIYDSTGIMSMNNATIWLLGWDDVSPQPYDPKVATTTLREGNWDWLQSKQTWTTLSPQVLPNSLYLTSKPIFFGSNPWPWVDPTTGTCTTLPAKARYDAGTPNIVI